MTTPLRDIFGGGGTTALADIFSSSDTTPSQGEINQSQTQNISDNITQLTALRGRAKNPTDQARIDRVIASLKQQQSRVGFAEPDAPGSDELLNNLRSGVRSVTAGIAKAPVEIGELAASIPAATGQTAADQLGFGDLRRSLAERSAQITATVQPPGVPAAIGEFVGELPAQMLAFGPVGKVVEGAASTIPALAKIFAPEVAGGIVKRTAFGAARAAAEVSPITAIGAATNRNDAINEAQKAFDAGQLTQEGLDHIKSASTLEAIKNFVVGEAGAAAFGTFAGPRKAGGGETAVGGKEGAAPTAVDAVKNEAELAAINAKAQADAAAKAARAQTKKLAKAQWTLENPDAEWNDLETEDQAKYIKDFLDKATAAATLPAAPASTEGLDLAGNRIDSNAVAATVPPRSPELDKGGGGQSPQVRNFILRQGLKKAYSEAGLTFDESLSTVDLQDKLTATIKDQGAKASSAAQQADADAANRETFAKMMAYTDVGAKLGIKEDIASMHAQGKTNNEILQVIDRKLPSYLTPDEKIDLIQAIRTDDLPKIDTSYEGLTGEATPSADTSPSPTEPLTARTVPVGGTEPSAGTESSPTAPPAFAVQGRRTFLLGVQNKLPIEEMTTGQLDEMKGLVADGIVAAYKGKDSQHAKQLMNDLELLSKETQRRETTNGKPSGDVLPRPFKELSPEALLTNREALEAKIGELITHSKTATGAERDQIKLDLSEAKTRLSDIKAEIGTRKIEAREAQASKGSVPAKAVEQGPVPLKASDFKKAPSTLSGEMLDRQIDDIHSRLDVLDPRESGPYQERLANLYDEKAKREAKSEGPGGMPPLKGGDGLRLQSHPAVGAFAAGFTYGLIPTDQNKDLTDEQYLSRAFMWGLGSAGLVLGAKYLAARNKALETSKSSTWFDALGIKKKVYSVDDLKTSKIPTTTRLREWYRGLVRSTDAIEAIPGVRGLPAERNPGKLAAYYGRYAAQAEHWLTEGPARVDAKGNVQPMPGLSYQGIMSLAGNDKEGLDNLVVALSSAELAGKLGENRVPFNQMDRERIIRNAPQNLMQAAQALRQYHANLLQTQFDAGLVSAEGLAKMLAENYYTPMQRVMEQVDAIRKANPLFKGQPTAIEARMGGSNIKVKSPLDVTVEMTARMLRAAEYGQMQKALVDHVATLPHVVRNEIIVPVSKGLSTKAADYEAIAEDLRKTLNISQADARGMISYLDHDSIHELPTIRDNKGFEWGIINHYADGNIQTLKVRPDVFKALKTMTQPEKDWFWSFIGAPTRLATKGVVLDPSFAVRRGFIESYLGYLGSEYGFRPGLDQMQGWWDVFSRSQRFRDMQAVGGTGNVGSLQFKDIARISGKNALADAWTLSKEMKPLQAMRVLMDPFLSAARAGENLAALRHGASTIEAAYAANNLLGNVRMQGYFEGMRRFNTLSMFARPTISHVDKLLEKSGLHPFRTPEYNKTAFGQWSKDAGMPARVSSGLTFATKGFASITLPSLALWYLNRNDDEINELRQTTLGSHYWFFRNPFVSKESSGSIIRLPKPQVIGQIFGTSVEAHLDNQYKQDPDGTSRMLSGIYDEAALNVLPQIGVIPMSLWANKDYRFGTPIVPGRDSEADPNYQGFTNASIPSRIISDKLSAISGDVDNTTLKTALSPAGIDYVLNTFAGMMGQDALKAVNSALMYHRDGFLPSKDELPIISRFIARYPSMNTYEVQKFYERDKKIQAASQTVAKIVKDRPDALGDYYSQNMDRIQLASIHQEVRQKIADMRRALEDVRNAPAGTYDQQGKDAIQKQFVTIIIQEAKAANDIAKNMSGKP